MTEQAQTQEVSNQDLELAIQVIMAWHRQKRLSFAIANSGNGLMISDGNAFEVEAALNHAHKIVETETGYKLMELRKRHLESLEMQAQAAKEAQAQ